MSGDRAAKFEADAQKLRRYICREILFKKIKNREGRDPDPRSIDQSVFSLAQS
jgi:hypothetical protein